MKKFYVALTALSFTLFGIAQTEIEPFAPSVPGTYLGDFQSFAQSANIPATSTYSEEGDVGSYFWLCENGTTLPAIGGNPNYAYCSVDPSFTLTLITPSIDFGLNTNNPTVNFSYLIDDGTIAIGFAGMIGLSNMEVMYKEGVGGSWNSLATYTSATASWTNISLPITGATNLNDIYIGFKVTCVTTGSVLPGGLVVLDDIVVTGESTCSNTTNTLNVPACDTYTVPSGDETYTASQSNIKDTIPNVAGCDSLLTINLTMGFSNTGTDIVSACDSLVWIDGNTYYTNNSSATHTLMNQDGCDSVVTLNLTVTTLDLNVTVNDPVLSADQSGAAYVWMNCADSLPISGANNQNFTPSTNGDYAVEITLNGCKDTSACNTIAMASLDENDLYDLNIYPNPTTGSVALDFGTMNDAQVKIYSSEGKEVYSFEQKGQHLVHFNFDQPKGVYLLEVRNNNEVIHKRLIKQ
ncbi:MAG: T9SS type A sorting domain-containing protein [Crocinitomicaceae bacterium]|nr:T9SS type A sorting domain-containing protein [Crocinitomicaceae bacterium]